MNSSIEEDSTTDGVTMTFDLDACRAYRQSWECVRDRRPDLYGALTTLDGQSSGLSRETAAT